MSTTIPLDERINIYDDPSFLKKQDIELINQDQSINNFGVEEQVLNETVSSVERQGLLDDPRELGREFPFVSKTAFYTHVILTLFLYIIGWGALVVAIVVGTELYIAFPNGFDNMISNTFLKYKIFILIVGIVRTLIGLLFLFLKIFLRPHWIVSLGLWGLYAVGNAIFGAFVGLIMVDSSSDKITSRVPIYTIVGVLTLLNAIILMVGFVISCLGPANKIGATVKRFAVENTSILRGILFSLTLIVMFNGLPFENFKNTPSWAILILMAFLVAFLFLVIVDELFDRNNYASNKRNAMEMSFYLLFTSSDFLFVITILIPSIGVRLFTNSTIISNLGTSNKHGAAPTNTETRERSKLKKFSSGLSELFF